MSKLERTCKQKSLVRELQLVWESMHGLTKLARKRATAALRQRLYRERHRERINAERRASYDPILRHERHVDEYRPKRPNRRGRP